MSKQNAALAAKLSDAGARMTPLAFEQRLGQWYKTNGKRLATFAGDEKEAKAIVAGLCYAASRVPKLMECSIQSLGDCLMQSGQLGLYPGALQQCAYLPFKGKATFVPQYQGLIKLAFNTGMMKSISADVVYQKDDFAYQKGTDAYLSHKPFLGPDAERGERVGVYCVIETTHGMHFEVKNVDWVESIRKRSPNGSHPDSPWVQHWDEMAKKSIFKLTQKYIPKDNKLAQAIELDNAVERPELAKAPVIDVDFEHVEESVAAPEEAVSDKAAPEKPPTKKKTPPKQTKLEDAKQ